jgi:hypothetical protein
MSSPLFIVRRARDWVLCSDIGFLLSCFNASFLSWSWFSYLLSQGLGGRGRRYLLLGAAARAGRARLRSAGTGGFKNTRHGNPEPVLRCLLHSTVSDKKTQKKSHKTSKE